MAFVMVDPIDEETNVKFRYRSMSTIRVTFDYYSERIYGGDTSEDINRYIKLNIEYRNELTGKWEPTQMRIECETKKQ